MARAGPGPARLLRNFESSLASALLLAALMLFLGGMTARIAGFPVRGGWVVELTVYLVVWSLFVATAACVVHRDHVRADFFVLRMGPKWRHLAEIAAAAAGLAFCLMLAVTGWMTVEFALMLDERGPSAMQFRKAWYYLALPVSMALCSVRYAFVLWQSVFHRAEPAA